MAKLTTIQHFTSIDKLKEYFKTPLPKPYDWRLMSPCLIGQINALPGSRGTAIATNGILVAIIQNDALFIGHIDFFVADLEQPIENISKAKLVTKRSRKQEDITEFI